MRLSYTDLEKKLLYSAGIQILMNKTKYFEVFAGAATAVVELFVSIFFFFTLPEI